jgi:hypothetical protein
VRSEARCLHQPFDIGLPGAVPHVSSIAINDLLHRTEVFPRTASGPSGFLLEMTAHGNIGDLAGVAISSINGIPLSPLLIVGGISQTGVGGTHEVQVQIPAGMLSPGTVIEVISGTMEPVTGVVTMGPPVSVTITP